MKHKVYINWILWLIGLQNILPRDIVERVVVLENNEPLESIKESSRFKLSYELANEFLARKTVCSMLIQASENLPAGFTLIVKEAYRSKEKQKQKWQTALHRTEKLNPNKDKREIERLTRLSIAQPTEQGGGHQTGGAIDVTLGDADGTELFLGTNIQQFSDKTPINSKNIALREKAKRKILFNAMTKTGFVNYPGEWWHYSFGDKLWAAYSRKKKALYGPVNIG